MKLRDLLDYDWTPVVKWLEHSLPVLGVALLLLYGILIIYMRRISK